MVHAVGFTMIRTAKRTSYTRRTSNCTCRCNSNTNSHKLFIRMIPP